MQNEFINCIEFVHYPFYGVQFHPEKPETELGINVSQTFINFFVSECKKIKMYGTGNYPILINKKY